MIYHICVSLLHASVSILFLKNLNIVAAGEQSGIYFFLLFVPTICLISTGNGSFKRNIRIMFTECEYSFCKICIAANSHPANKMAVAKRIQILKLRSNPLFCDNTALITFPQAPWKLHRPVPTEAAGHLTSNHHLSPVRSVCIVYYSCTVVKKVFYYMTPKLIHICSEASKESLEPH